MMSGAWPAARPPRRCICGLFVRGVCAPLVPLHHGDLQHRAVVKPALGRCQPGEGSEHSKHRLTALRRWPIAARIRNGRNRRRPRWAAEQPESTAEAVLAVAGAVWRRQWKRPGAARVSRDAAVRRSAVCPKDACGAGRRRSWHVFQRSEARAGDWEAKLTVKNAPSAAKRKRPTRSDFQAGQNRPRPN